MLKLVNALAVSLLIPALAAASLGGCSDDDDAPGPGPSEGGKGGSAQGGSGGSAQGGSGGSSAGAGGAVEAGAGGAAGSPGKPDAFYDLTIDGTGFTPHVAHSLTVALIRVKDGATIATQSLAMVGGDTFSFTWPGVLRAGGEYALDYYADVNASNSCDPPPPANAGGDHVWRKPIPAASANTTFAIAHDTSWTDQCGTFNGKPKRHDVTFKATMFQPHANGTVVVAVTRNDTGDILARKTVTPVAADGTLSVTWKGLVEEGVAYNVDYYADVTNNGRCDDPPDDHVWRRAVAAVTGDVTVEVTHDSEWGKYCDSFNK